MAAATIIALGIAGAATGGVGAAGLFGAFNNQVSENTVNDILNISTNITIENINECLGSINESQVINITGNNGEDVEIKNINWSEAARVDTQCMQKNKTNSEIEDAVKQRLKQLANNLNKKLLGGGSQKSENKINIADNLSTTIANTFTNKCAPQINQQQTINIAHNKDGKALVFSQNWKETAQSLAKCIQQDETTQKVRRNVQQQIDQTATNKLLSPLTGILIGIGLIVIGGAIIFFFLSRGSGEDKNQQEKEQSDQLAGQMESATEE